MPEITRHRFLEIKRVFLLAEAEPRQMRSAVLDRECAGDPELRRAVEQLLNEGTRARGFLRRRGAFHPLTTVFEGTTRFEVRRKLGAGGFGDVYEAFDRVLQQRVALKVLRQFTMAAIYRFKREFRAVERLSHPNVGQIYELLYDSEHGCWLLVMELVHGVDFLDHLARSSSGAALRSAFGQLAAGIQVLHEAGILHCDIKPSNVLVTQEGRVVLLDFGLAKRLSPRSHTRTILMGTPDYAAPEQICGEPVATPADWYSFGVMLYRALSGHLPFHGTPWQVMTQKQNSAAPPLENTSPEMADLGELCLRLLRRDPAARPRSPELLHLFSGGAMASAAPPPRPNAFFGREQELQIVLNAFEEAVSGRGLTVHIAGTSGIGKTAFLNEAVARIERRYPELLSLTGKCYEGESVPYKALDEVVEDIASRLQRLPPADADAIAPRDFGLVGKLFPALEAATPRARLRQPSQTAAEIREQRHLAFSAFRELLARLADRQPTLVFIDDLQWGDEDSALLLRELMDNPAAPAMLLLLAYRSEDEAVSPALQSLRSWSERNPTIRVELGPLHAHDARELAAALVAPEDSGEISEIAKESGGNPFLLQQLTLHSRQGTRVPRLQDLIEQRVQSLPESGRRFLEVLSVARAPLTLPVLREAAALGDEVLSMRSLLTAQALIRNIGTIGEWCETYHDRIAEAVAETLPGDRRREYHEALAVALENARHEDTEAIAQHFRAAGRLHDACRMARLAAGQAASVLAFDRAARLYQSVLEWSPDGVTAPERSAMERARGDSLVNCGRGIEAARAYQRAMAGARPDQMLELRIRAAAELFRSGEVKEGLRLLRELLAEYGLPFPRRRPAAIAHLIWERVRLSLRGLKPRHDRARARHHRDAARMDVCWAAASGFGMVDPLLTELYCAVYLRLVLDSGDPRRLAVAFASYASRLAMTDDGQQLEARTLMMRAERYAEQDSSAYVCAYLLHMQGLIEMLGGNWRKCRDLITRALSIYRDRCTGVAWETTTATSHLFTARAALGDWISNAAEQPLLLRQALDRGDRYSEVALWLLTTIHATYVMNDEPDAGDQAIQRAISLWPRQQLDLPGIYAFNSLVYLDLYRGLHEQAWGRVEAVWDDVQRSGLLQVTIIEVFITEAKARAGLAMAAHSARTAKTAALLRAAETIGNRLAGLPAAYAKGMGLTLLAGAQGVRGNNSAERGLLREAAIQLEKGELAPWLAAVNLRLAHLSTADQADRMRDAGLEWMRSQNVRRPDCLVRMLFPYV